MGLNCTCMGKQIIESHRAFRYQTRLISQLSIGTGSVPRGQAHPKSLQTNSDSLSQAKEAKHNFIQTI